MNRRGNGAPQYRSVAETIRRAFEEFLGLPSLIVAAALLLAVGILALERAEPAWLQPIRAGLQAVVFGSSEATIDLLGTIAGGLITVATLTVTLLLLALQQNAAQLSTEVFDQFLRRRSNQFYFGFFIGLALYSLVILASVNEPFNPVLGATVALLLTMVALYVLIVLLYSVIDQMRPAEIMATLHRLTLRAREGQHVLLARTRRESRMKHPPVVVPALASRYGYVTRIDLGVLEGGIRAAAGEVEVVLRVSVGGFVSTGDVIANVGAARREDADAVAGAVIRAVRLERQRDIVTDPGDGIEELGTIAWTSISSSKSNPAPGLDAIRILRDLLARWSAEAYAVADGTREANGLGESPSAPLAVVYQDVLLVELMNTIESLAVVSSESMQHQSFTETVRMYAALYDRMPDDLRRRAEDSIGRILSALGDHVLTFDLDQALTTLVGTLRAAGRGEVATVVESARERLALTVGHLHSRSTRA